MKKTVRKHWPLLIALAMLWATVGIIYIVSTRQNGGQLVYALDDAYIHMAIAKNFSQHGIWGVTQYAFGSSTSSVLWTLILSAIYRVFGVNDISPLALNVLSATGLVWAVYAILHRHGSLHPLYILVVLLGIIYLTPLPVLIYTGHEHTLHALVSILFLYLSATLLSGDKARLTSPRSLAALSLALCLPMIRYEGLFLVLVVCLLFLLRKRWAYALTIGAVALAPLGIYGLISVGHGWQWLPNSVLLKGHMPKVDTIKGILRLLGYSGYQRLFATHHVLSLVLAAILLYIAHFKKQEGPWQPGQVMLAAFVGTALLHMQFAATDWFYRYEAYVVALGLFVVAPLLLGYLPPGPKEMALDKALLPKYAAILVLAILLVILPYADRGLRSLKRVPDAMNDRYYEHIQPARFVAQYYDDATIAVNDIGAMCYYTDARVLDLYGLANMEPVVLKKSANGYTARDVFAWTASESAKIAILQVEWREILRRIPDEWAPVGEWQIPDNVVFGDTRIGFFAVDPDEEEALAAHLSAFASQLPAVIKQSGAYTE